MQRVVLAMKAATVFGILGAIALGVIKETRGRDLIVMNRSYVIGQTACFVVMLAVLVGVFSAWAWRIVDSHRRGMYWSARRKKAVHVRSSAQYFQCGCLCPCTITSGSSRRTDSEPHRLIGDHVCCLYRGGVMASSCDVIS